MSWINSLIIVFDNPIFKIIKIVGSITSIFVLVGAVFVWFLGAFPIVKKLGIGRWNRKIGVFASESGFSLLKNSLTDSGVFRPANIQHLIESEIEQAKTQNLIIVEWDSFGKHIETIYSRRPSLTVPVIIYAIPGSIEPKVMSDLANRPHTVVVNARGRLLNDVLTSLMTS